MAVEDMNPSDMRRTPAWTRGWDDANEGKNFHPGQMDRFLYTNGYRACQAASGVDLADAAQYERAYPLNADVTQKEEWSVDMTSGWQDSYRGGKTYAPDRNIQQYDAGFEAGVQQQVTLNQITVNQARGLLGLPPEEVDVEFDPVKIPGHYNSGTIEVTNFISDQGLDFTRGNVVKYVSRAGKKDPATEIQDLEKAAAYLQMAHNLANGKPAVVRDPVTKEVVWSLFKN